MINYVAPYIPKLSDCTAVSRQLNKKNTDFTWNNTYEKAFRNAKLHVANAVTLQFFNPDKDIVIECDASGVGIGGTLLQDGHPITFISQALTSTQQHYSNIERELLVVVVMVEHLCHYIFADCLSRLVGNATAVEDESLNLQIADLGVENMRIDWQI